MSDLICFSGAPALTEYRHQQLLQHLKLKHSDIVSLSAHYVYCALVQSNLEQHDLNRLSLFLPCSKVNMFKRKTGTFYAIPRLGTISPWSSKATDIAKTCGFEFLYRVERGICYKISLLDQLSTTLVLQELIDPMMESIIEDPLDLLKIFRVQSPGLMEKVDVIKGGKSALVAADRRLGLALSQVEIDYLVSAFQNCKRNPTDVELMMFAQVNSEHCRHKIFNAQWTINGDKKNDSLFSMIKNTHKKNPESILVAYSDNAAVLKGSVAKRFWVDPKTRQYSNHDSYSDIVFKVETHNHPTAISPFPGAATGSGGEIRDEAATGRGARPKMGLTGFSVSHLQIPKLIQPWELDIGKPAHIASALDIMLEAPVGSASFNNEFGRPNLCGYFRTFGTVISTIFGDVFRGYHKPIMIAGGLGNIHRNLVEKKTLSAGDFLIVLGGPSMSIGLGGGAASSKTSNDANQDLNFSSVQRSNPEMERRCQEVIDACWALGDDNLILSIHDVGAGGLSNALAELVQGSELGAKIQLRNIPNAATGMTPMEIWCNEAQERYVLAIRPEHLESFSMIAVRERCPFAVVGEATQNKVIYVEDTYFNNVPVNLPMSVLFKDLPRLQVETERTTNLLQEVFLTDDFDWSSSVKHVLQFPCVASKQFLITIADRSVSGLVARDQMVGPWQVPVADVAVTCSDYEGYVGEALSMGERTPIAVLNQVASARMAVGEAITNIAAADVGDIRKIALSANWMAATDFSGDFAVLYDAVQTIGLELCPELGISIPVGKDSLSMRTEWQEGDKTHSVTSPLSLVISAAARVRDVRRTLTPELHLDCAETVLLLLDLGAGSCSLGASVLAQTQKKIGGTPPDLRTPAALKSFFEVIQRLNKKKVILSYHDRSDGGLLATISEMMFAAHVGVDLQLAGLHADPVRALFNEELGALIQVKQSDLNAVLDEIEAHNILMCTHKVGSLNGTDQLNIYSDDVLLYSESRVTLQKWWSETSYQMQALRDHAACAKQEYDSIAMTNNPGLNVLVNFDLKRDVSAPYLSSSTKPKLAILREQGVNGQLEMAAAFTRVGFSVIDVHMSDLLSSSVNLKDFVGLAACGGFSYGDVLGAGRGWAQSILIHPKVRDTFAAFFERRDTFTLGVCNGCQMLSYLKQIIPGADAWPIFLRNKSEQFEARLSLVKVIASPSIFLKDMEDSVLPIAVAHGEGRAVFSQDLPDPLVAMRYVDNQHQYTNCYPENPNGSLDGITALTNIDGRVTIMMPHPERVFRSVQFSWSPKNWDEESPWLRFFGNARKFSD